MGLAILSVADAARGELDAIEGRGDAGFSGQTEASLSRFGEGFAVVHLGGFGVQRRPVVLIEPGAGTCHEAKEYRSRVPHGTRRGHDAGIVARTKPGDHQCNWSPL
ncbi:MAG: hypothetical protein IT383_20920 [Deltaproteobacteria bacterium]|nr:hypothetical protein [Deltaproteobacteria bacterium]